MAAVALPSALIEKTLGALRAQINACPGRKLAVVHNKRAASSAMLVTIDAVRPVLGRLCPPDQAQHIITLCETYDEKAIVPMLWMFDKADTTVIMAAPLPWVPREDRSHCAVCGTRVEATGIEDHLRDACPIARAAAATAEARDT